MKVEDIMSRHVEFIDPGAPVQDAAVLMGELDVGGLPVGTPERLEGILTDRDILYRVVASATATEHVHQHTRDTGGRRPGARRPLRRQYLG